MKVDIPLLLIGALLVATVAAYAMGRLSYPVGLLVLSLLFVGRLMQLVNRE
jgi:ABC-type glycerol-3-phosphate transport system permease component